MIINRRKFITGTSLAAAGALAAPAIMGRAWAQSTSTPVKIGLMSDFSSLFEPYSGSGAVDATRMAIEDFGGEVLGQPIEVIQADHQNKTDVGVGLARQWFDQDGVDLVMDLPNSAVALAVQGVATEKKKNVIVLSGASSDLSGSGCSPYGFVWIWDTYSASRGIASAVTKAGGDSWFFLTSDYAFGYALERDAAAVVEANGGKVLGEVRHPLAMPDLSAYLLQAQASGAKVIGLANSGNDTRNAIKQAREFGIVQGGQQVVALLLWIVDIHALGLEVAQGTQLVEAFYWDMNDQTRAFSKRFRERDNQMPTMAQAGAYSATTHYLNAIKAAGTKDTEIVTQVMHETKVNDFMTDNAPIREDGRLMRDLYVFEVKTPEESKGEWDYYNVVRQIPAAEAVRSLADGACPYVKL